MGFQAARLHGEVLSAGTRILDRRSAGDDLELVHRIYVHVERHNPVVSLLIDRFRRDSLEVQLLQIVARTANHGEPAATRLCTRSENAERRGIALRAVHLNGQICVLGILNDRTQHCAARVEHRRCGGHNNSLRRCANRQYRVERQRDQRINREVLLCQGLESLGGYLQRIHGRRQGGDGIAS